MKITKKQLKQIIKEEINRVIAESEPYFPPGKSTTPYIGRMRARNPMHARGAAAPSELALSGHYAGRDVARLVKPAIAFGAASLAVDAIDAMGGAEIRQLIAKATGGDPSSIPTPDLKQRLKALASPVTGMVDLAGITANELAGALGLRSATQDEIGAEAWGKKIASEKEAEYMAKVAGGKNVRDAPHKMGRHSLPIGAKLADIE